MAIDLPTLRFIANIPTDPVVTDTQLAAFTDMADLIVAEDLAGQSLSVERLDQIALYLAAHFATISIYHGGLSHQRVSDSEERYQPVSEKLTGLATTKFGQSAISLDTSGTLSKLAGPSKRALFEVI